MNDTAYPSEKETAGAPPPKGTEPTYKKGERSMKTKNGYATNQGGLIKAPVNPGANDPRATVTVGKGTQDLRNKK